MSLNPDIQLEVTTEDRMVDLIKESYDLVIVGSDSPELATWTVIDLRLPAPPIIREAVLANAGIAIIAYELVAADLAAGRMNCWGKVPNGSVEIWVLHTSRRLVSSKVATFVKFLCETYRDGSAPLKS